MKIIHTADWQLGKPYGRFPQEVRSALSEARLDAIDRIASAARDTGAGQVLVAGDVFDNVEPGNRVVVQAMSRMGHAPVTWWLMPGNHDHLRAGGLWSRVRGLAPPNVRVIDRSEPMELDEGAWLLPAPLEHRRTREDPTALMVGMATPPGALRIGLAHGSITDFGASGESPNQIPPDRARTAGLDYLALGDWHGFLAVGDRTAYSGTPEIDRFGREDAGACIEAIVRTTDSPVLTRRSTGRYRWLERRWDFVEADDLAAAIEALRGEGALADVLLALKLSGTVSLANRVGITASLEEQLSLAVRHLEVDAAGLIARPTAEELAEIDVQGALAGAAAVLRERAGAGGPDGEMAAAALERLYVEALRFDRGAAQ
ncbi:DNA repair exonuclease [Roseomonas hellenica]|uniref:DNA repair exonuclease n=1 Tax=Plastoroseomonas hellenica TaxID=2687306 RepID=A0ABS5EUL5_9PROT|nr:DNA repair exonuclease [Plastoroseomonas hellenica]